jgi:hypothetical protein
MVQVPDSRDYSSVSLYEAVSTLETMDEFKTYAQLLNEAGYYVPRSWTWGMSIRDRAGHR